jgi:cytochrome c-type biogenesis protein CcmH
MPDPANGLPSGRAREIEEGLLAPCCWTQTLDFHESELARALRQEIAQRVARGEASQSIRDNLAARYGEAIIAVPSSSPLPAVAPVVVSILGLMAIVVVLAARRWRSASRPAQAPPEAAQDCLAYDEALRKELLALRD